jgi:hypothetical protein
VKTRQENNPLFRSIIIRNVCRLIVKFDAFMRAVTGIMKRNFPFSAERKISLQFSPLFAPHSPQDGGSKGWIFFVFCGQKFF